MSNSRADELRTKGNNLYKEIRNSSLSRSPAIGLKLAEADKYYVEALEVSSTAEKRASAYKNRGSLAFLWAKWELAGDAKTSAPLNEAALMQCKQRLADTVLYYIKAWEEGRCYQPEWLYKVEDLLLELIDWAAENEQNGLGLASADPSSEFSLIRSVCEAMNNTRQPCIAYCYAHARIFDLLFWGGVEILKEPGGGDDDRDNKCLVWMSACQLPLERLQNWSRDFDATGNIAATAREWQDDIKKILSLIGYDLKSQARNLIEEKENEAAMKKDIIAKLAEKLKALKFEAEKSTEDYLRFIYANHTHPNPNFKLGKLSTPDETKEAITTALRHYHPDRNIQYEPGWHYLCEEITKILNTKYEFYR